MKKKLAIKLVSTLALTTLALTACQLSEETGTDTSAEANQTHGEAPKNVDIQGLSSHYHSGDTITLTASTDEDTTDLDWHWYTKNTSDDAWELDSGQGSNEYTGNADTNGLEIKAVLVDENEKPHAQSLPATIEIDDHGHVHDEESQQIYNGYFDDDQVEDRLLKDWEGDWQSVYPYLEDGSLDDVFVHKAESGGDMTAEEYKTYYEEGYVTDVDRIVIEDDTFYFFSNGDEQSSEYEYGGYEILTYEKGNRGVRYIFKQIDESDDMPTYIQFSDHSIFPTKSHHFHLYWGDNREALLEEVANWPTYYPTDLDAAQIAREMIAH
ncbi:metal-binding protein ZinT [Bacillus sp. JCM 19041]|uniref:ZinT family metal-binding protein n=1 Tax=Bacillus sp. JCM 19041 TaxID=1460637 RepID=UPI0006D2AEAD